MRENDGSAFALVDIGHSPALDFQELLSSERLCAIGHYCSHFEHSSSESRQSSPHVQGGSILTTLGSDNERSQGGRHVPNHAPTVASSVLNEDIAGRQRHLRAIVELECQVAGENDPEIRRVGPVKAGVSATEFVAILEVHLGSGFGCNEVSRQVRPDDEADATYGREYTGRRRIVPRVRVGCGLIRIPEEGKLS